jgi:Skp family chaperone for outer membrane proteins
MFQHVCDATQEVAAAKGIDLVLAERKTDLPTFDTMKTEEVAAALAANTVLYSAPKADITNDVLLAVDKKYVTPAAPGK